MTDSLLDNQGNQPAIDPTKDYREELVGEGKKFKTDVELARGKYEADLFIEQLKREKEDLRQEYLKIKEDQETGAKLQELIDKLDSKQQLASSEHTPAKEVKEPELDLNLIDTRAEAKYLQMEATKKATDNFNQVRKVLNERFGDNSGKFLQEQMETLGLTIEELNARARRSPSDFLRTVGLDKPQATESFQTPPRGQAGFRPNAGQKRTWSYYQEMKRKNPKLFEDRNTNIQMMKDIAELGEEFKDGDFKAFGD